MYLAAMFHSFYILHFIKNIHYLYNLGLACSKLNGVASHRSFKIFLPKNVRCFILCRSTSHFLAKNRSVATSEIITFH